MLDPRLLNTSSEPLSSEAARLFTEVDGIVLENHMIMIFGLVTRELKALLVLATRRFPAVGEERGARECYATQKCEELLAS